MSNLSPEFALLGFLLADASHGYDLHQRFTAELGHVWHLSQSQAYAILNRLEKHGDISARLVEPARQPARQTLRITPRGRARFMEWLENGTSRNARAVRLEFLTRLYFAGLYKPEIVPRIFGSQHAETLAEIRRLEIRLEEIPADQPFNRFNLDLRLRQMKLVLDWLDEIGSKIEIPLGDMQ